VIKVGWKSLVWESNPMPGQRKIQISRLGPAAQQQLRIAGFNVDAIVQNEQAAHARKARSNIQGLVPTYNKFGVSPKEMRTMDGILFASKREMQMYAYLRDHKVRFDLQPEFILIPGFEHAGKAYGPVKYRGDFLVYSRSGQTYIVDAKGFKTPEFKLKNKMMLSQGRVIHCISSLPDLAGFLRDRNCVDSSSD
jgi:hypothetical protein